MAGEVPVRPCLADGAMEEDLPHDHLLLPLSDSRGVFSESAPRDARFRWERATLGFDVGAKTVLHSPFEAAAAVCPLKIGGVTRKPGVQKREPCRRGHRREQAHFLDALTTFAGQ